MIKENLRIKTKEIAFKVQSTSIDAIRKKDITKKGVRVYENGFIGVAGSVGEMDNEVLEKMAIDNLNIEIPYEYNVSSNLSKSLKINQNSVDNSNIASLADEIVDYLREEHSAFDFSESIKLIEKEVEINNSENLDLSYEDSYVEIDLMMKNKKLANLFDGFVGYTGRNFDMDKFKKFNGGYLNAHLVDAKLPETDKIPVIISVAGDGIMQHVMANLNGERYASGVSLFAGKIGEKIFDEKINVVQNSDSLNSFKAFFDAEGVVNENLEYELISNGNLKAVYNNKKIAKKYKQEHTGASSAEYDSVPSLGATSIKLKKDSENLKKVIAEKGGYVVVVMVAAGGDFTSDGDYASPVQISLLFDGDKFIGKLPEFSISSNMYKMFGEDYIGTFESPMYFGDDMLATMMMVDIIK